MECQKCGNRYKSAAALNNHLLTSSHSYPCTHSKCTLVFHSERYLRRHIKLHTTLKAFSCNKCSKSFKTEAYLKVHLQTHSNKSFKCDECGTLCGRKDIMVRHIRAVHQQRVIHSCPFKNEGCTKEFYRKGKYYLIPNLII